MVLRNLKCSNACLIYLDLNLKNVSMISLVEGERDFEFESLEYVLVLV